MLQETAVSRIHYRNSTCFATDIQMVVGIKKSADSGTLKLGIGTKPRQIKMTMEEFETYLNGNQ